MFKKKRHAGLLILVLGLIALLPVLASLQFQWLGALSESEIERKRTSLSTSARNFARAFENELQPIRWNFRVSNTDDRDKIASQLALGHQYWITRSEHLDLIEDIYWVDYNRHGTPNLHYFDPGLGRLYSIEWPDDLHGWQEYFQRWPKYQREQIDFNRTEPSEFSEDFRAQSRVLMTQRPAIPLPVSVNRGIDPGDLLTNLKATSVGRAGHTLITLNKGYISDHLLLQLDREFLSEFEGSGLDLLITSGSDSTEALYQSADHLTIGDFEDAFTSRPLGRYWRLHTPATWIALGYAALLPSDSSASDPNLNRFLSYWIPARIDSLSLSPDSYTDTDPNATISLEAAQIRLINAAADSLMNTVDQEIFYPWTLRIRLQDGSLETTVKTAQNRNLIISFTILLLLGIASVLIYVLAKRSQKLANDQMDFVAGISHELRTPLSVIQSAAANLEDGVVKDESRSKRYGILIGRESRRLSAMVEQVLELAGVQSGRKSYNFQVLEIESVIQDALATCQEPLQEGGFDVSCELAENIPQVLGDPAALHSALTNLLNNAIKYSNGSRWIGIESRVEGDEENMEVVIQVQDRGHGIDPDELPHIFEPFFRGQEVRQAQIRGNGIGLSLVQDTMTGHGGRVSVESVLGKGSTFTLHLPVAPVSEPEPTEQTPA